MNRPIKVGLTHGDVNGIGYEVILKALDNEGVTEIFTPVIFGVPSIADKAKKTFDLSAINFNIINNAGDAHEGKINLVQLKGKVPEVIPGEVRKDAGASAAEALEMAVEALKNGQIDVLVTAPISKESIQSDSFHFPGHTEFLTERLGGGKESMMILCNDNLRVALLTKHLPLSKIPENIKEETIIEAVEKFASTLKQDFGIVRPTIAVLSLNPHGGDGGLLGVEEEEIIKPAINQLSQKGVLAFGPFPADGFFGHGSYKKFDGVLAMYHDQGLAPFKTIATSGGVNFTAALPYVRTSPDHGTAFDIAWKGEADPTSMREAIYMAIDIFRRRQIFKESNAHPLKKYVHDRPERGERQERNDKSQSMAEQNQENYD